MTEPDLQRAFVVALELLMPLYAMVYAFPFVPDRILEDPDRVIEEGAAAVVSSDWIVVEDIPMFHEAIANLLCTSRVLLLMLRPDLDVSHLRGERMTSIREISYTFELNLMHHSIPGTCRQMYQSLAATYNAVMKLTGTVTRQDLNHLYQYYGILDRIQPAPTRRDATVSAMVQQCSEQAFRWLQPYFSVHPEKYWPPLRTHASAVCQ
jgi:hypothetical protein